MYLSFARGSIASSIVDNNLNTAHITYTNSTVEVKVELQTNADMIDIDISSDIRFKYIVENPETGEYSNSKSYMWILFIVIVLFFIITIFIKKKVNIEMTYYK